MDFISSIIMGIIEGLTEFLPVSSTGHMILTAHLLGLSEDNESVKTFEVVVRLGAVLAVVVLYWNKFIDMFRFTGGKGRIPAVSIWAISFWRWFLLSSSDLCSGTGLKLTCLVRKPYCTAL